MLNHKTRNGNLNHKLTIRISGNEQEVIRLEAAKDGVGVAEYCRRMLLGYEGNQKKREDTLRNVELALRALNEKVESIQSEFEKEEYIKRGLKKLYYLGLRLNAALEVHCDEEKKTGFLDRVKERMRKMNV